MVLRLYIHFSLFLNCSSSLCFVDAIFDLKLIPSSQKSKLSNRKSGTSATPSYTDTVFLKSAKLLDSRNSSKMEALNSGG